MELEYRNTRMEESIKEHSSWGFLLEKEFLNERMGTDLKDSFVRGKSVKRACIFTKMVTIIKVR